MPELFLYHSPLSPCAHKVRLVLEDRAIPWRGQVIDLGARRNLEPEYLAVNPRGLVPALVVDGHTVIESAVICELLEDLYSEHPRRPRDPFARAQMRIWVKWADDVLHLAGSSILYVALARPRWQAIDAEPREALFCAIPDSEREAVQRSLFEHGFEAPEFQFGLESWATTLPRLESELAEGAWLAGDDISLADLAIATYVHVLDYMQVGGVFERYPEVAKWYRRIRARPGFARSLDPFVTDQAWAYIASAAAEVGPMVGQRLAAL